MGILLSCENGCGQQERNNCWPRGACTVLWTLFKILLINIKLSKHFSNSVYFSGDKSKTPSLWKSIWFHGRKEIIWQTSSQPHCFKLFSPYYYPQCLLKGESLISSSPLLSPPSLRSLISLLLSSWALLSSLTDPSRPQLYLFLFNKPYFPNV